MCATFVPGVKLCEQFYQEAVQPILLDHFPKLKYAAALIGPGSEVLGFDDELSTDHHWGPRVMLFIEEQQDAEQIVHILAQHLPHEFLGYSTNFTPPDNDGVQVLQPVTMGPINHRVTVQTMRSYFLDYLGFDIEQSLEPADWLTFSEQYLRTINRGVIYRDEIGLRQVCARFDYYPRDVWLYLMAAGWTRIGQEEHLMGRAGMRGDEIGSAIIGARLVRDIMRLWFLMEKVYAPYPKWFGTACKQLPGAQTLWPMLQKTLSADTWQQRGHHLAEAYEQLAIRHNALKLTEPLPEQVTSFYGRPFQVIGLHGFDQALLKLIEDPQVKLIAERPLIGGIDLLSDNTDFASNPFWRPLARRLYE